MTVAPSDLVKKITASFGTWAVIFLYYLRFIKRAARVISTIAKANNASYVTISTKVRMKVHRHHPFLVKLGRSKILLPERRSNRHRIWLSSGIQSIRLKLYYIFRQKSSILNNNHQDEFNSSSYFLRKECET